MTLEALTVHLELHYFSKELHRIPKFEYTTTHSTISLLTATVHSKYPCADPLETFTVMPFT